MQWRIWEVRRPTTDLVFIHWRNPIKIGPQMRPYINMQTSSSSLYIFFFCCVRLFFLSFSLWVDEQKKKKKIPFHLQMLLSCFDVVIVRLLSLHNKPRREWPYLFVGCCQRMNLRLREPSASLKKNLILISLLAHSSRLKHFGTRESEMSRWFVVWCRRLLTSGSVQQRYICWLL